MSTDSLPKKQPLRMFKLTPLEDGDSQPLVATADRSHDWIFTITVWALDLKLAQYYARSHVDAQVDFIKPECWQKWRGPLRCEEVVPKEGVLYVGHNIQ